MKLDKSATAPQLPLLLNVDNAAALCLQEKDPFYLVAFMLQNWLGDVVIHAATEYAEKKNPKERALQSGEAWRRFNETFKLQLPTMCYCLFGQMLLFIASDNSHGNSLRRAWVALNIEHEATGDYLGPKSAALVEALPEPVLTPAAAGDKGSPAPRPETINQPASSKEPETINFQPSTPNQSAGSPTLDPQPAKQPETINAQPTATNQPITPDQPEIIDPRIVAINELARRTIIRWCDWVDAAVHMRTHRLWHLAPGCFDPDPDTRHLAALGNAQRHIAKLDPRAQAAWLWDFSHAAEHFKDSPKWAALGKAMAAGSPSTDPGVGNPSGPLWTYQAVDTLVIALWPLVKTYNWTYRDLLNVIRPALKRPKAYPCEREQDFATYCTNVLGLRKTTKGATARNGKPAGHEIAIQLIWPTKSETANLKSKIKHQTSNMEKNL
ncbi:MAG TPA: hypothetical protein VN578_22965 [Candidatus Binatia bacterium]|jgi:hypothetical protein|nr:hypothetical protein [Candidatus Binatia bacterium]